MSAPLRPAPCTRTSRSESPGTGSGCSSTAIEPSRIVAARMRRDATSGASSPSDRPGLLEVVAYVVDTIGVEPTPGQYVPSPCYPAHSAFVARIAHRPRGRRAAAQPGLRGVGGPTRRAPSGAADPGFHGRRSLARHDVELAAAGGLLHPPHGYSRQLRLLGGSLPEAPGAARAPGPAPPRGRGPPPAEP